MISFFSRHPCESRGPVSLLWPSVSRVAAIWPLTQRAFRPPAGGRVTFLLLAHARAGARANGEAGPKGGGQDARSKRKVTQRKWPDRLVAFRGDKPERVRKVGAWQPSPLHSGYFKALRNAPSRRGLRAGRATLSHR